MRPLPNKVHIEGKEGLNYVIIADYSKTSPNCEIKIHYMETEGKFPVKLLQQSWLCILLPCLPAWQSSFPKGAGLEGHDTTDPYLIDIIYPGCTPRTNKRFQLQHCKYDSNMALTQPRAVSKWYGEYPSLFSYFLCINQLDSRPSASVNTSGKKKKKFVLQSDIPQW